MSIILCGQICSGKDTFAAMFPGYHRLAFADIMKDVARTIRVDGILYAGDYLAELFGHKVPIDLDDKLTEFQRIPHEVPKERRLLQELGTWCRQCDPDIWVRPVKAKAAKYDNVIITDCRYLHELHSFPSFTSVYIEAPLSFRITRMKTRDNNEDLSVFDHPAESEIALLRKYCDITVVNDGSLENLQREAMKCLSVDKE